MNKLFEQIDLKPFHWIYRRISDANFNGFYHWHQGCELLFVYRGKGQVIVNQQTYEIKKGMLFFFQPFQLHKINVEVSSHTPYERSIMHFDPKTLGPHLHLFSSLHTLLHRLQNGVMEPQAFDLEKEFEYVYEICESLNNSLQTSHWEEDSQLFLMQMLSCIRRNLEESKTDRFSNSLRPLRHSERMMNWIEKNYTKPFDLDQLSADLHLSKSYASRVFKREVGSSLTEYITIRRIKQACQLLQMTTEPVEIIGECVGIGSVSYFIQLFKKMIGTTPHQFRISHQRMVSDKL
ncbi:AraC family transcriptional regulator [Gracilibacillus oryzae]|nr:AraC family transcriptional regulator [Gracilibacillus oryzae]